MKTICLVATLILLCVTPTFAANNEPDFSTGSQMQCAELIKECFSSSGVQRTNCFYTSAKHPFCEGTEVGKLSFKRWTIGANTSIDGTMPPGLLGPSMYNEQCLSNCDTKWLSELVPGDSNPKSLENMNQCYDNCKEKKSLEILRP